MDLPHELPDVSMSSDSQELPDSELPLSLPELPDRGHWECLTGSHKPLARGLAEWLCSANDKLVSASHGREHWTVLLDDIFGPQESFAKYLTIRRLLVISDLVPPTHPSLEFIGWGAQEWAHRLAAPWQKKGESKQTFIAQVVKVGKYCKRLWFYNV